MASEGMRVDARTVASKDMTSISYIKNAEDPGSNPALGNIY